MNRVFLDTNLFIYTFEGHPELGHQVVELVERIKARNYAVCTSAFTLGEILVKPIEVGDQDMVERYRAYFSSPDVEVLEFGREAAIHYAKIRQDRTIRPPDAIQLACAASVSCQLFLTSDDRLTRRIVPQVPFISSLANAPI